MPLEQFVPELDTMISVSEPIQMLADRFGGSQGPGEGPLWWQEGEYRLSGAYTAVSWQTGRS